MHCCYFKVLVLGATFTGKTSIIHRYIKGQFIENHVCTSTHIISSRKIHIANYDFELQINDTAGSEDWISVNSQIYHDSQAVIYLCSYDSQNSLSEIISIWEKRLGEYVSPADYISFVCVNKSDIDHKTISEAEIEDCAQKLDKSGNINQYGDEFGIDIFKVSAKFPEKGESTIEELFTKVGQRLVERFEQNLKDVDAKNLIDISKSGMPEEKKAKKKSSC